MDTVDLRQGDNLEHLRALPDASVDLVATDPPYYTQKEWKGTAGEFSDSWETREAFVEYMRERAVEMRRVLKSDGALYWQCDPNISPWLRIMLNGVFGERAFNAEISWRRTMGSKKQAKTYGNNRDYILFYGNPALGNLDRVGRPASPRHLSNYYRVDKHGRWYMETLTSRQPAEHRREQWRDWKEDWAIPQYTPPWFKKPHGYDGMSKADKLETFYRQGLIYTPKKPGAVPMFKSYLAAFQRTNPGTFWDDIDRLHTFSKERTGYPTQKPVALYERIVLASSPSDGVVLDPFCGSGTTGVAALRQGRSFIGMDANPDAIALASDRLKKEQTLL